MTNFSEIFFYLFFSFSGSILKNLWDDTFKKKIKKISEIFFLENEVFELKKLKTDNKH